MSENIAAAIALNGEIVVKQPLIKSMRVVKKETLKLISDWVSRSNDHQMVIIIRLYLYSIENVSEFYNNKFFTHFSGVRELYTATTGRSTTRLPEDEYPLCERTGSAQRDDNNS